MSEPSRDRQLLLAERDAARRDRLILELRGAIADLRRELRLSELEVANDRVQIARLDAIIFDIHRTRSWRWSAPVRLFEEAVARVRDLLGLPVPASFALPLPPRPVEPPPRPPLSLHEAALVRRLRRGA